MINLSNPHKWEDILQFTVVFLFIVLINIHANRYFFRLDLTEERRYTISEATKKVLENLEETVYIEVYLDGDLNSGFRRLQKSTREILDEFRVYAGERLQYKFVNPDAGSTQKERNNFYSQLVKKGIQATQLFENQDGKKVQKIIFPAALVSFQQKETPLLLLKGNKTASPDEQLNQSIEGLEFEFAQAIQKLSERNKKSIAIISGHEELTNGEMHDLIQSLEESYYVDRVDLRQQKLDNYEALILAQPKTPFSEREKFYIDQFVMRGGKAMFFLDMVQMNLDSIAMGGAYAFGYDLNLTDLLFRYGVRPAIDLVQDMQMGMILLNVGTLGDRPNLQPVQFPYYVTLNKFAAHPSVRNLNGIYARFFGTIDTVRADAVQKTPLVFTNQYSRTKKVPTMVSLDELKADLDKSLYQKQHLPVAYMLEGKFTSLFKNRYAPAGLAQTKIIPESKPTKVLVFADGDLLKNEIDRRTGKPLPLGYEMISQQTYSNKDFVLNSLSYMLDDQGLILSRSRQITLRPLDRFRTEDERFFWQILNLVLPLVLVLAFGIFRYVWRKKKYEGTKR